MKLIEHVGDLRAVLDSERAGGATVGFVPTMGYFHEGHRSLMRAARADHDVVVVSIFVNPLQFGENEDLAAYPSDPDGDAAACEAEGVDLLFRPRGEEMFPGGCATVVHVDGLTDGLCAVGRPTHFDGVATVVTKLFSVVGPCAAYFGRKDFQQLTVVERLVRDLSLPVDVVGCPLVREGDGLAMSSRNAYLDDRGRDAARVLFRSLCRGVEAVRAGERDPATLRRLVANHVTAEPRVRLEYVEVVRASDLTPLEEFPVGEEVLVALAARSGAARLIDNVTFVLADDGVDADLGINGNAGAPLRPADCLHTLEPTQGAPCAAP